MNSSPSLLRARRAHPKPRHGRPLLEPLEQRITPAAGLFDPGFGGGDGKSEIGFPVEPLHDDFYAMVRQADGKIIAVGAAADSGSRFSPDLAVARFHADGSLDTSFGDLGKVTVDFDGAYFSQETAYAVTLDADGKIVIAGRARVTAVDSPATDFFVARLTVGGTLDPTFGGTGFVLTDFGSTDEEARGVAVQSDGHIVVAGRSGGDVALARFTATGALDTTFDTDGKVTLNLGGAADRASGVVIQPDGKIVIGGTNGADFVAARFTPAGALDTTFSGDGIATFDLGRSGEYAIGVGLDSTGRIVLAGQTGFDIGAVWFTSAGAPDGSAVIDIGNDFADVRGMSVLADDRVVASGYTNQGEIFVARWTSASAADGSFGTGGVALAPLTGYQTSYGVLSLPDGSVITGGTFYAATRDALLVKFTPSGTLDTTFSGDGVVETGFFRDSPAQALAALLQPDGKYIIGGVDGLSSAQKGLALARFNVDGTPDLTFGGDGTVTYSDGAGDFLTALAMQGTKIIAAGYTLFGPEGSNMLVVRFNADGSLDTTFGNGGSLTIHLGGHESANSLVVAADNSIFVGGGATNYARTTGGATLIKLTPDGALDASFDGDGRVVLNQFTGGTVQRLGLLGDGRIAAAIVGSGAALLRFTTTGALDPTFDGDGIRQLGSGQSVGSMLVAADGAVTFSSTNSDGGNGLAGDFRRLLPSGAPDSSFGVNGVLIPETSGTGVQVKPGAPFLIDSAGRIVATAGVPGGSSGGFGGSGGLLSDTTNGLLRLNPDGTRDVTFGDGGFARGAGEVGLSQRADGAIVSAQTVSAGKFGFRFQATQLLDDVESSPNGVFRIDGYEFTVRENQGPVQIVVKRVGGALGAVSVDFTTVAGTALAGSDFVATSGTLNFADGDTEETITVNLTVDQNGEATEKFSIVLSNPQGGALLDNPRTAIVTIPLHLGPSGGRDTGYGDLGFASARVLDTAGTGFEPVLDIARDAQGRVLVFGSASAAGVFGQMIARFLPDGTLDTSFSADGTVFNDITGFGGEIIKGLVQPDGKILTISKTIQGISLTTTTAVIGFTRYLSDGMIDRTFGNNGFTSTDLPGTFNDTVRDAAQLPDGKVVVAITADTYDDTGTVFKTRARLVRFNVDGTLDTTFGVNGIAETPEAQETTAFSMVVLGDGDILLTHSSEEAANNSRTDIGVTRFNADGSVDTAFGTSGVIGINTAANGSERPTRLLVQPDGKLVVAGYDGNLNRQVVLRLEANGTLDPTFDTDGIAFGAAGAAPADAVLKPSGKLVVFGTASSGRTMTQYNADGTLDGTFGIGGTVGVGTGVVSGQGVGRVLLEPDNAVLAAFDARLSGEPGNHAHVTLTRIFTEPRPGKFSFNTGTIEVDENTGLVELTIIREDGAETDVTVNYTFNNGSATGGADFTGVNGSVLFLQGETSKTIVVPILDDTLAEGRENFTVSLSGAPLGATATSMVTITDGPGVFQFGSPQLVTVEGIPVLQIPVIRTNGSDGTVTVAYSFADGSAVLGEDYVGTAGRLTFSDREVAEVILVYPRNDTKIEGTENFTVTLSQPSGGATIGALGTSEVLIFDSEPASGAGAGSLDRTFGTDGVSRVDIQPGNEERAWDVTTLPDGRILAVGESGGLNSNFLLVRFTTEGLLDPTWGGDGIVEVDFGGYDVARSVLIGADGNVTVAGYTLIQGEGDFAVARLRPDGALDPEFSQDGKVLIDFAKQDDRALEVVFQPDGKLVLGGSSGSALGRDFAAARLNVDGSLDNTFSSDGRATVDFEGRFDYAFSVAVDSKGRILLAGDTQANFAGPGGFTLSSSFSVRGGIARLTPDGTLDTSFAGDGTFTPLSAEPSNSRLRKVLIRPGDEITAVGFVSANFLKFELTESGGGNPKYGYNFGVGTVELNFPRAGGSGGNGFDQAFDAVMGADGSLLLAGISGLSSDFLSGDAGFAKFNADGTLDSRFAVRGLGFLETAPVAQAVAYAPDGRIISVGPNFEIARVLGQSAAPPQGVFQLNTLGVTVEEIPTSITFTVDRPRDASAGRVSVNYTTVGGTALPGLDFTAMSGTLVFEESETTKTFSVPILNDSVRELQEQFSVLIFGATGGAQLSSFRSAVVSINANDSTGNFGTFGKNGSAGGFPFDIVSEQSGFAFLGVSRSSNVGTVTIDWATVDGTAKAGEDYVAASGTITFAPGVSNIDFAIIASIIQDSNIEGDEDFFIEFSNPTGGASLDGSFGLRRVVIPDYDPLVHINSGEFDPTFDGNGRVVTSFGGPGTGPEAAYAVARDASGKLVVVGQGGSTGGMAVARFNADGSLDTTFSTDGKVLIDVGTSGERAFNVNIRPDGKLLIFGQASAVAGVNNPSTVVARLNPDGSLDTSFGGGDGLATMELKSGFTIMDVESLPDGKFVVAGEMTSGLDFDWAVMRFKVDGTLDTTFSGDGVRTFDFGSSTDLLRGLALQPDGKIVLTGVANDIDFANDLDPDRTIRLNADGSLDTTFANGGVFIAGLIQKLYPNDPTISGSTFLGEAAIQPDGKILLVGQFSARDALSLQPTENFRIGEVVIRLNANGTLDTSFSGDGFALIETIEGPAFNPISLFNTEIAVDSDGKIYVTTVNTTAAVLRLLPDGQRDIGFGRGGVQAIPFDPTERFISAGDLLIQPDGKVVLVGSNDSFGVTSSTDIALIRLKGGPDAGDFRLHSGSHTISEDGGSITIRVERVAGFDGPASVTLTQEDGTALAGVDYTLTTQTLSWGNLEAGVKTVTIPIINDALAQGDLTFTVKLTNPTNGAELNPANMAPTSAPVTIVDDENQGEFNFKIVNYKADENGGMATIEVTRLKGKGGIVTVDYAATAGGTPATGTAVAGVDFTPVNGTLTFGDGVTTQTFNVPLFDDGTLDFDKTVMLALSNNSAGTALGTAGARLTIVDNEKPTGGVFDFSAAEYVVNEDGTGIFITITRTGGMGEATVVFTATPGTASALDDYGPVSGTLLFEAGVTSQQVFIPIFEDGLFEGDETIALSLSDPMGDIVVTTRVTPTLGLANATLRIADNDPAPLLEGGFFEFTGPTFSGVEKSAVMRIFVTRVGGAEGAATVDLQLTAGTATAAKDFTATTITVTFEDGQLLAVVEVPVRKDLLSEANETFTVALANPTGSAFLGDLTSATATIVDDDARALPDIDGDGDLDLVLLKKGKFYVHLNPGDGNYPVINPKNPADAAKIVATVKSPTSFVFGDFDGDGNDDLAVLSAKKKTISLLLGNDDGTFDAPVAFLSGPQIPGKTTTSLPIKKGLLVADFDNDGRLDLAGITSKGLNVLFNDSTAGTPNFAPAVQVVAGKGFATLYAGDFDRDGNNDLAAFKGGSKPTVNIFEGRGDETFRPIPVISKVPKGMKLTQVADVNGDENLDFVAIFPKNNLGYVAGPGTFFYGPAFLSRTVPLPTQLTPTDPKPLVFGFSDFDDDLDLDLVAINAKKLATALVNMGTSFAKQPAVPTLFKPTGLVVADVNGDDDPDLVLFDKSDRFKVIRGGPGATFPVV